MKNIVLTIAVTGTPSNDEDLDVPGTYRASVREDILLNLPSDACDMALDALHMSVAIGELDDFQITVTAPDGTVLHGNERWTPHPEIGATFLGKAVDEGGRNLLAMLAERIEGGLHPDHLIVPDVLQKLVGVSAPDAKRWYGSGRSFLESVDEAIDLANREMPARTAEFIASGIHPGKSVRPGRLARQITAALLRALAEDKKGA